MTSTLTPLDTVRAVIYLRISEDRTGREAGVDRQRQDCEALALELGWTVVEVYKDNDKSAYSKRPREHFERMLEDIAAGRVDAVLAWHTDRLYRRPRDLERLTDAMDRHAVVARTVKAGHLDMSTASAVGMTKIGAVFAEMSSAQTAERVKAAARQRAFAGRPSGGPRCYGYAKDGLTVVDTEAAAIRSAVDLLLAGRSLSSVAATMPDRPERPGKGWTASHLRNLLLSPRLAGHSVYGLEDAVRAARKARGDVAGAVFGSIVAVGQWPAILEDTAWRTLVRLLTDPSRRQSPGSTPKHVLSGIARCAVCDALLRVSTARRPGQEPRSYYRCPVGGHARRPAAELEEQVVTHTLELLDARITPPRVLPAGGDDAGAEQARLQGKLTSLASLFAADSISAEQFETASREIRARVAALPAPSAVPVTSPATVALQRHPVPSKVWPALDLDSRRAVLRDLWSITVEPFPETGTDEGRLAFAAAKAEPGWGVHLDPR